MDTFNRFVIAPHEIVIEGKARDGFAVFDAELSGVLAVFADEGDAAFFQGALVIKHTPILAAMYNELLQLMGNVIEELPEGPEAA